jgi:hypothetical protein
MQYNQSNNACVINNTTELEAIASWSAIFTSPYQISLRLPNLHKDYLQQQQAVINSYLSACGCEQGRIVLATSILGYILYLHIHLNGLANAGWTEVGIGFGIACLGAILGKTLGLIWVRLQLQNTVRRLKLIVGSGKCPCCSNLSNSLPSI